MFKVEYITNSIFNSRTYILLEEGSDKVWLVDCGDVEPSLLEKFPDVVICTNEWGKGALADDRLNMSHCHESPVRVDCSNVQVVKEGDNVFGFDVYETPGHNPSCLCFANRDLIFTGDAYIPGCKVVMNFPHSNKALAQSSVERILRMAEGKKVFPGHEV